MLEKYWHGWLRRWFPLLLFLCTAHLAGGVLSPLLPAGPAVDQLDAEGWFPARGMRVTVERSVEGAQRDGQGGSELRWQAGDAHTATATRVLTVDEQADFIELHACVADVHGTGGKALMLASMRGGALDFNRQYALHGFESAQPGDCVSDALPRRDGDDSRAAVQLQFAASGDGMTLSRLTTRPLIENPRWYVLRLLALPLGCLLLLPVLIPYILAARHSLAALAGVLAVAAILFGCLVSVPLKADIFALLTGGRELSPVSASHLLSDPFPTGGFSLFTFGHLVLFAGATLFLGYYRREAVLDMLLLGCATETLQMFVPGRGPGVADMLIDWSGVLLAVLLLLVVRSAHGVGLFAK